MNITAGDVLSYWFGDAAADLDVIETQGGRWFASSETRDREIGGRFGAAIEAASAGGLAGWTGSAPGALAVIVLIDQFRRNVFRNRAEAFAADPLARAIAARGVEQGQDQALRPIERVFFYLPFEHSEAPGDQQRSVALFSALTESVPPASRSAFEGFLRYAEAHREVIARFGRFPHRNEILGRPSTIEEQAFLAQPGSSF